MHVVLCFLFSLFLLELHLLNLQQLNIKQWTELCIYNYMINSNIDRKQKSIIDMSYAILHNGVCTQYSIECITWHSCLKFFTPCSKRSGGWRSCCSGYCLDPVHWSCDPLSCWHKLQSFLRQIVPENCHLELCYCRSVMSSSPKSSPSLFFIVPLMPSMS